jgi:FkbH-like protein
MAINRNLVFSALSQVMASNERVAVVHSSLAHLRLDDSQLRQSLLAALKKFTNLGLTLVFPSFTLSFCRTQCFDIRQSNAETGILSDWVMALDGAIRTPHPIYSFVVIGPLAQELATCKNTTTFGDDSVFAWLESYNARIVMLGAPWRYCTQFHRYEEEAQVPYRHFKTFSGKADFGEGSVVTSARMYVRRMELAIPPVSDFQPAVDELEQAGSIQQISLGYGTLQATSTRDLAAVSRELLREDEYAFVKQKLRVAYHAKLANGMQKPLRIAVLGQRNLALLEEALRDRVMRFLPDRELVLYSPPYGQMFEMALQDNSPLRSLKPDVSFFVDRLEDILRVEHLDDANPDLADSVLSDYFELIRLYAQEQMGLVFVNRFATMQVGTLPHSSKLIERANRLLDDALSGFLGTHVIETSELIAAGNGPVVDPRLWALGRIPLSKGFTNTLADHYAGLLLAMSGRTIRLIVVDLDNTLWGGVLGEDGISEIQIGGDYPGNAFLRVQKVLRHLANRGIALAICSKNDEDLALRAFRERPEMALRVEDFAVFKINWQLKSHNIARIAHDMNLDLENILFVDDNPVEREQMRQQQPAVKVLELPDDPAQYASALIASPYLAYFEITDADRKRAKSYQVRSKLERERKQYSRIEDFYATLEISVHIFPLSPSNLARAEQLINKTNQFNATGRRYHARELEALKSDAFSIYVLGLEDRFTELENIGVLMVRWNTPTLAEATVDNLLLSCRVLGRGVESGVLAWLKTEAVRRGVKRIWGKIIETERNTPVRGVFQDNGFTVQSGDGDWAVTLSSTPALPPEWLSIVQHGQESL